MAFKLLALHSRATEVTVGIKVGDIVDGVADLLDLGLEPVVVVVRVLGMAVQDQDPVHVLTVAEYIKALVTYHQKHISDVDKLDSLLEHIHILVISRHTLRVPHH